jgi:hypothetical protein
MPYLTYFSFRNPYLHFNIPDFHYSIFICISSEAELFEKLFSDEYAITFTYQTAGVSVNVVLIGEYDPETYGRSTIVAVLISKLDELL